MIAIVTMLVSLFSESANEGRPPVDLYAVVAEVDQMASRTLWPGFDLKLIPIALYDGRRTLLLRHPKPPDGFIETVDRQGIWVFDGLHKDVRANTATEIGGVLTAVVMLDSLRGPFTAADCAAVVAHEAFHVYERTRHKEWGANEAELFNYPVENSELLRLRRLESEALRRALAPENQEARRAWAALALQMRRRRFTVLGEAGSDYERGTEKIEGLAQFVQSEALGKTESLVRLTPDEFPPAAVRLRSYSTGIAIALLLNHLDPPWKENVESDPRVALDELLQAAVADVSPAQFTPEEIEKARLRAEEDTAAFVATRQKLRADFLAQDGWRITIVAAAQQPMQLQGFDPMNVERLSSREVLHTRWLRLGNQSISLEALNRRALTVSAGPHPLFSGVAEVTVASLPNEPELTSAGGRTSLRAEGFTADFGNAEVRKEDRSLTIELVTPKPN